MCPLLRAAELFPPRPTRRGCTVRGSRSLPIGAIMKTANILSLFVFFGLTASASAQGPVNYPDMPEFLSTKSRAEVEADFLHACQSGLRTVGDAEMPIRTVDAPSTKTRHLVQAELATARRLALLTPAGERGTPITTQEQERQIGQAGLDAISRHAVAGR